MANESKPPNLHSLEGIRRIDTGQVQFQDADAEQTADLEPASPHPVLGIREALKGVIALIILMVILVGVVYLHTL